MIVESRVRGVQRVAVIAAPPVSMFNLAIPEMLFGKVEVDGAPGYETVICAPTPGPSPPPAASTWSSRTGSTPSPGPTR